MTDRESLEKAAHRFRVIADDTNRITSGNMPHNLPCLRGFALRAAESIERHLQEPAIVYVVTRCEEHADYTEKVFLDESKAQAYCDKFNNDDNEYARNITKIDVTL